jgi:hypothetical protein
MLHNLSIYLKTPPAKTNQPQPKWVTFYLLSSEISLSILIFNLSFFYPRVNVLINDNFASSDKAWLRDKEGDIVEYFNARS